jgi:hypothetical protein
MLNALIKMSSFPIRYSQEVYRMVETQEAAATTNIVDNLDEQFLLEQLLDEVKPPYRNETKELHYLISTPFRYPPLLHGSRFGDTLSPSYFYASEDVNTVLAESAYYRFIFLDDMKTPYLDTIKSEHMTFSVKVDTHNMCDLTSLSDIEVATAITSPFDYRLTQQFGNTIINKYNCDVIRFLSARTTKVINLAISDPKAIKSKSPSNNIDWLCLTTPSKISFSTPREFPISYSIESFLINCILPRPA